MACGLHKKFRKGYGQLWGQNLLLWSKTCIDRRLWLAQQPFMDGLLETKAEMLKTPGVT